MTELKRLPLKYIRDYIKKDYKLKDKCYICGCEHRLELHHLYSISELFNNWCDKKGIRQITTEEAMLELRVLFAKDCEEALSADNLYTLCYDHHKRLHTLYGQRYGNHLSTKIKKWLEIQREKHGN